jgi:hypothetical protein
MVFAFGTTSRFCPLCLIPLGLTHFRQPLHILAAEEASTTDRRCRWGKLTLVCQLADSCWDNAENASRIRRSKQLFHLTSLGNLMQAKMWGLRDVMSSAKEIECG